MIRFSMKKQTILSFFLLGLLSVACGVVPRSSYPPSGSGVTERPAGVSSRSGPEDDTISADETAENPPPSMKVSSLNEAKVSLMQAYHDWKGTPYVLGGASENGVDCSRFVNIVFDNYLGIELPTNTREQLNTGIKIRRHAIRTGDLVFFKTGRKTLHVGIAVNSGEFLHASTSNGVMISKLGKNYWRNRFLAARRVL